MVCTSGLFFCSRRRACKINNWRRVGSTCTSLLRKPTGKCVGKMWCASCQEEPRLARWESVLVEFRLSIVHSYFSPTVSW